MENSDAYQAALTSLAICAKIGFEPAVNSSIPSRLRKISPVGSTAMRDAVMTGIKLLLDLQNTLSKLGTSHVWNFVHIVLTDGEDTSSKAGLNETLEIMRILGQKP